MAEDFQDAAIEGESALDINDPSQMQHWMQEWDVSERDLRMAVANVGTEVAELRIALGR